MKKILLFISFLIVIFGGLAIFRKNQQSSPVFAEGGIEVTYAATPLFNFTNMYPGQTVTGRVTVKSTAATAQNVGLKLKTYNLFDLLFAGKLTLKVKDVATDTVIFGGDSGKKFTSLALTPKESFLFALPAGASKDLDILIQFDPNASNNYQGRGLNFDLSLGFIASGIRLR